MTDKPIDSRGNLNNEMNAWDGASDEAYHMTDITEQIRECPFCGKQPDQQLAKMKFGKQNYRIVCCQVFIEAPKHIAIARWNTRQPAVQLERLDKEKFRIEYIKNMDNPDDKHLLDEAGLTAACNCFGTVKESNTDHTNYACICKECGGQIKVPTVDELGDFIYQTLHITGGEPTNTLSKPVCYELGRLIHQLLAGGEK